MKPQLKINDRWSTRPQITGERYTKKSMVTGWVGCHRLFYLHRQS